MLSLIDMETNDLEPLVCSDSTSESESEQKESTSSSSVVSLLTKLRAPRKSKLVTLCITSSLAYVQYNYKMSL